MTSPARKLARTLDEYDRRLSSMERANAMSRRSIEGGGVKVYDTDGTLRGNIGIQPDGTTAVVTVNDPTPPTPSAPILEPISGGLAVTWDGSFADGSARPNDLRRVDVHAAPSLDFARSDATLRASFVSAGTFNLTLPPDAYTVLFVAYTTGGTASAESLRATETPAAIAAEDLVARQDAADALAASSSAVLASTQAQDAASEAIAAASAASSAASAAQDTADAAQTSADGKVRYLTSPTAPSYSGAADSAVWRDSANGYRLNRWNGSGWDVVQFGTAAFSAGAITADLLAATAIDGKTITGALIRTAASGQRVQLDSTNGLVGYNSAGTAVTQVSPADGSLIATNATVTGELRTAISGGRVRLRHDTATGLGEVQFYSGNVNEVSPATLQAESTMKVHLAHGLVSGASGAQFIGPQVNLSVDVNAGRTAATKRIDLTVDELAVGGFGTGTGNLTTPGRVAVKNATPATLTATAAPMQVGPDPAAITFAPSVAQVLVSGDTVVARTWNGDANNGDGAWQEGPLKVLAKALVSEYPAEALYDSTGTTYRGRYLQTNVFGYDYLYPQFRRPTVYRSPDGYVTLSGLLGVDAALAGGKVLAILPAKYRPSKTEVFVCLGANNRAWRCDVDVNGQVIFSGPAAPDWTFSAGIVSTSSYLSLSGIHYATADVY